MSSLQRVIENICGADKAALLRASKYNDALLKPLGSLGKLEAVAVKLAGITGQVHNRLDRRVIVIMAADHGIWEEGVSCSPQEITRIQAINMTKGTCGVGVLARQCDADLKVIDIGILENCDCEGIIDRKVRRGTANFKKEPAMTRQEAIRAIEIGIEMVEQLGNYDVIGTGEMGIGNTSSTSACLMALTGISADEAVGRGGGLSDEGLTSKKGVLEEALRLNKPNAQDPIDVLSKVGGLDIAGLTGCFLGAAYVGKPILIDGAISALAAFIAVRLCPFSKDYMFATHRSKEPAYQFIMAEIGLSPMLDLDMRLGEGTGCALAFPLLSAACALMNEMTSYGEMNRDDSYRIDNREEDHV